jgi:diacylglycerol kinase family enzyme
MVYSMKKMFPFKIRGGAELKKYFTSCLLLVNPSRYPARARRLLKLIGRIGSPHVLKTETESAFTEAVRGFVESEWAHLLIFGGDGTINRALNILVPALQRRPSFLPKSIGFLRGGSGNGYHDSYGIPRALRKQLLSFAESIHCGYESSVDMMEIRQGSKIRYGQLMGIGFDAAVLKRRNTRPVTEGSGRNPKPGLLNYVFAVLTTLRRLQIGGSPATPTRGSDTISSGNMGLEIHSAGMRSARVIHTSAPLIAIGKRPYYGNRFRICPGALPARGPMEVVVFDFKRKSSVVAHFLPLWLGWHRWINLFLGNGRGVPVQHFQADSCILTAQEPFDFQIDGELITTGQDAGANLTVNVSLLENAVSFLVPKTYFLSLRGPISNAHP